MMLNLRQFLYAALFLYAVAAPSAAADAGRLPKTVVPRKYEVRLETDLQEKRATGTAAIAIEVKQPTREILLNAVDLAIERVELAGGAPTAVASFRLDPDKQLLHVQLRDALPPGTYRLSLAWSFQLNERAQGLFLARHRAGDGEEVSLATQMEPADARRMLPCWDEPAFRSEFQLTVVIPADLQAISNMPETETKPAANGRKEVVFAPSPSMPSYLLALFVGRFEELTDEVDGVQLRALTTPGKRDQARYALDATKLLLPWFNEYFGVKYPLPKLDQLAIPGAPASGMENWGAILYNDTAFLYDPATSSQRTKETVFGVVAHELAHQWFGNLVTMEWWDDLWLNEGFASWIGTKATAHFNPSWEVWLRAAGAKEWAMWLDARATTHPIQQPVPEASNALDAFDAITYSKGQSFLRMLEQYLGEEKFRQGLRSYMAQHAYGNATTGDLWHALGEAAGQPVADIASEWTTQPGFPLVKVNAIPHGEHSLVAFSQERFAINQRNPEPLTWKIPISFATLAHSAEPRSILLDNMPFATECPATGTLKVNLEGIGYYRVQYADGLFQQLAAGTAKMSEADRLNLLQDTWALVQAGKMRGPDWLGLVNHLAAQDGSYVVWDAIISQLGFVDDLQRGQSGRAAFRKWAVALAGPQLQRLGWEARPGERELDALLRSTLIGALARWGDEPVINEARRRFAEFLERPASLTGDLRRTILGAVGRHADAATYEILHRLARSEASTEQKRALYWAMSNASSPVLAERTLALAITDELLPREATRLVHQVGDDGEHPEMAWEFTRKNLEVLLGKLSSLGANEFVPGVFRGFNEEGRASELESFSKSHLPPQAAHAVAKAADNIRFKAEFRKRLLGDLDSWIAEHGAVATEKHEQRP